MGALPGALVDAIRPLPSAAPLVFAALVHGLILACIIGIGIGITFDTEATAVPIPADAGASTGGTGGGGP